MSYGGTGQILCTHMTCSHMPCSHMPSYILENIMCATLKNYVHFNCLVTHWNKARINTAYNTNWSAWSWEWVKIFVDRTANALWVMDAFSNVELL